MSVHSRRTASFSVRVTMTSMSPSSSSRSGTKARSSVPDAREVAPDPAPQRGGLADVDHLAGAVPHEVAAGLGREAVNLSV